MFGFILQQILHDIIVELTTLIIPFLCKLFVAEWSKLDLKYCKSFFNVFRNYLLKSIRRISNPIYGAHNPIRGASSYQIDTWAKSFQ